MSTTTTHTAEATIKADAQLPIIHITRDFRATPAQLVRAHTDKDLFQRWIGPDGLTTVIDQWDARTGGSYRYHQRDDNGEYAFRGCFHTVSDDRLVQTFTWEGMPDGVSLDTMVFEDLGNGITRMHSTSLLDSFESRDGMLSSGMEVGISEGYAKLDRLLEAGEV